MISYGDLMASQGFSKLRELITHRVTVDVAVLSGGRVISSAIGLLIGVIVGRLLGPADFGLFSIAMVVFGIAVVIAEMGLGTSLVRFIPFYLSRDEAKAAYYLQTGFWTIFAVSLLVSVVGLFLARPIAIFIYNKPQLVIPLRLGFVGVVGGILWSYFLATLHAKELFKKYALISVLVNILKLGTIGAILWLSQLTVSNVLLVQIFIPVLGFIIGMLLAPVKLVGVKGDLKSAVSELFNFGKWIFVVDVAVMLFSRIDMLLLARFVKDDIVGFYSAAYTFIYAFTILTSSLVNVLLPRVAKMTTIEELRGYMRKILKATLFAVIFLLPGFYLISPVVYLTYGEAYWASVTIFQVMFVGSLFNFVVEPLFLVVYAVNRPQLLALVAVIKLVISLIANLILIPMYQATGAAIATVFTHVLGGSIALFLIINHLNKAFVRDEV